MTQARTPEIRFDGFDGEWNYSKLSIVGQRVLTKNSQNERLETFTNSAEKGVVSQRDYFSKSISNELNIGGYTVVSPDDFVYNPRISVMAPVGPINRNKTGRTGLVSPLYTVFSVPQINVDFAEWFFATDYWHSFMRMNGDMGARHDRLAIGVDRFYEMPIPIPVLEEQRTIGIFLSHLDTVLDAGEKKLQKLRALKQTMLTKMFPQGDSRVPEIRFKGFGGGWTEQPFNETFQFGRSVVLSRAELNDEGGEGKSVHYGDILTKFGYMIDTSADDLPFITDSSVVSKNLRSKLSSGDVIMADTAEDDSVGRCVEIRVNSSIPVFAGLHTHALRPTKAFAEGFMGVLMNSPTIHDQIVHLSQGTKVTSVSKDALNSLLLLVPSESEQEVISAYFREFDVLLDAESQKLEKLRHLKSAFLSSMFV